MGFLEELDRSGKLFNYAGESSGLVDRLKPAADVVADTVREAEELVLGVRNVLSPAGTHA